MFFSNDTFEPEPITLFLFCFILFSQLGAIGYHSGESLQPFAVSYIPRHFEGGFALKIKCYLLPWLSERKDEWVWWRSTFQWTNYSFLDEYLYCPLQFVVELVCGLSVQITWICTVLIVTLWWALYLKINDLHVCFIDMLRRQVPVIAKATTIVLQRASTIAVECAVYATTSILKTLRSNALILLRYSNHCVHASAALISRRLGAKRMQPVLQAGAVLSNWLPQIRATLSRINDNIERTL